MPFIGVATFIHILYESTSCLFYPAGWASQTSWTDFSIVTTTLIRELRTRAREMESFGAIDMESIGAEPREYLELCDTLDLAFQHLNRMLDGEIPLDVRRRVIGFLGEHGAYTHKS
jgi:hypothetical protein